ncbi:MAG TPA: S8 family serine peptidase [Anaerolineales bacterium]|nr:S8 family serine peptidase [Anaerolineales bacterium]
MKLKWLFNTAAITLLIVVAFIGLANHDTVVAAQDASSKIESALLDRFTAEGGVDFIVRFADQADLSAAYSMDWNARGEFVYNTLRETADRSQVNAKAILEAAGLKYQSFFAGNDLYVYGGTLTNATALATLPEVYYIHGARTYQVDPTYKTTAFDNISWAGDFLLNNALTTVGDAPNAVAWGLTDTGATSFWTNFGVRGDGMVVANIDTGVDYTHVALDQSYKCSGNPSSLDCWYDPGALDCSGPNGGPCDTIYQGIYHGTHTMGTMVGDDDPGLTNQVGMAPSAQWIACLGLPFGSGTDADLYACADWIIAPNGNTANRPDVVNNSWGGTPDGDTWYQAKVNAWRAAGVFPAFSAGNSGSSCDTMGDPGSYQESFAAAAHDSTRTIASFSSRGPSAFGDNPYTKPNISAPGVSVLSTQPGNAWSNMSGTSMASPHVAGAVALLWSCNPALVGQIDTTFQILQNNADAAPAGNCGTPPDGQGNYTYGYGYLNVNIAGAAACGGVALGTIEGHVYDMGGTPLEGASVSASAGVQNNQVTAITDPNGYYTMNLIVGTYDITASKTGYTSQTVNGIVIEEGATDTQDFNLTFLGQWTLGPTMCFDLTRLDGEYYPGTGLVYFLGGRSGTTTNGSIYSFNPTTETCSDTGVDMPTPISNYTVNLVNNGSADLLCTFGGRNSAGTTTRDVQCYNPNTNSASIVAQLPVGWTGYTPGAQVVVNNLVYIFGGFNSLAVPYMTARTDVYNPGTGLFTQLDDLNMARSYILATAVDGVIYAFGGDTFDGASLVAQTISEKFDPAVGTWDDASVADLPVAGDEGIAFGFNTDSPYALAGQIVLATLSQWSGSSSTVVSYDVGSNTYNVDFPDLLNARRNHAGVFIPVDTDDPADGLPGMWVFRGYFGSDNPPYAPTEFFPVSSPELTFNLYLPLIYK